MNPAWTIDDTTPVQSPQVNGSGHGYVPRNTSIQPMHSASPSLIKVYPRSEWPERIKEKTAKKSRLSDIRNRGANGSPIPFLNQSLGDGVHWGYCWAHSAVHGVMLQRAKQGLPFVLLSAFSVATTIMNGRNEGGWAALAFDWIMKNGVATDASWPQLNANPRLWTAAMQQEAAANKLSEGWWDAGQHPGLRSLSFDQVASLLLDNVPTPVEFNWWGHSVLGLDLVEVNASRDLQDPNRWGIDILNSWKGWGENGVGRLVGNRAIPNSAVGLTSVQVG